MHEIGAGGSCCVRSVGYGANGAPNHPTSTGLVSAIARFILNIQDFVRDCAIEDGPTAGDLLARRLMKGEIAI